MEERLPSKSQVKSLIRNGLISESTNTNTTPPLFIKIGEFFDVLAVA